MGGATVTRVPDDAFELAVPQPERDAGRSTPTVPRRPRLRASAATARTDPLLDALGAAGFRLSAHGEGFRLDPERG